MFSVEVVRSGTAYSVGAKYALERNVDDALARLHMTKEQLEAAKKMTLADVPPHQRRMLHALHILGDLNALYTHVTSMTYVISLAGGNLCVCGGDVPDDESMLFDRAAAPGVQVTHRECLAGHDVCLMYMYTAKKYAKQYPDQPIQPGAGGVLQFEGYGVCRTVFLLPSLYKRMRSDMSIATSTYAVRYLVMKPEYLLRTLGWCD